jgi:cystathionine beta-lyase
MSKPDLHFNSLTIHGGQKPDPSTGAVMQPIFQTSTFAQAAPGEHQGYEYARSKNPTRSALEKSIASLEAAAHGLAFGSGLAAIDAVLKLLKPGDEVIASNDLYGGTYRLFTSTFKQFGIKFQFVDLGEDGALKGALNSDSKMLWIESPTNPMMNIVDIAAVAKEAKESGLIVVVDNTFASPYLQQPLNLGADIVMHSATKYLAGHSDVVLGLLATNSEELAGLLAFIQNSSGAICGPMDAFLCLRGIKTLHLRMQRHCENGRALAEYLKEHPEVSAVYWPGFKNHPGHNVASAQMRDFGGMLSFRLKQDTKQEAVRFLRKLRVFTLAESLGGVESLAGHPASMTHASLPPEERAQLGISEGLIRLSVGVEDIRDLIADVSQALDNLKS